MEDQKREFVGGIKKVTPENIYKREQANYQSTNLYGLNQDFLNKTTGFFNWLDLSESRPRTRKKREEFLIKALDSIARIPKYAEHFKNDASSQTPHGSAALAEDAAPYIQAIDELVADMKALARDIKQEYGKRESNKNIGRSLIILRQAGILIARIVHTVADGKTTKFADTNNLQTHPFYFMLSKTQGPSESEALERIKRKIEFATNLLERRPLPESFSYLRDDGNVTPVDWEPTDEDRKKLAERPKKIRP